MAVAPPLVLGLLSPAACVRAASGLFRPFLYSGKRASVASPDAAGGVQPALWGASASCPAASGEAVVWSPGSPLRPWRPCCLSLPRGACLARASHRAPAFCSFPRMPGSCLQSPLTSPCFFPSVHMSFTGPSVWVILHQVVGCVAVVCEAAAVLSGSRGVARTPSPQPGAVEAGWPARPPSVWTRSQGGALGRWSLGFGGPEGWLVSGTFLGASNDHGGLCCQGSRGTRPGRTGSAPGETPCPALPASACPGCGPPQPPRPPGPFVRGAWSPRSPSCFGSSSGLVWREGPTALSGQAELADRHEQPAR